MMMSDIYWIFHGFIKCHLLKKRSFILWMCHHHPELRLQCNLSKLLNSRAGTADTGIDYFRKLAWLPKAPLCKVWNLIVKKPFFCWGELFERGNESYEQTILLRGGISLAGKNSAIYERSLLCIFEKVVNGKIIKIFRVKNKKTCWLVTSWKFYPIFGMMRGLLRKKGKVPISNFALFYRIKYMLHA